MINFGAVIDGNLEKLIDYVNRFYRSEILMDCRGPGGLTELSKSRCSFMPYLSVAGFARAFIVSR